MMSEPIVGQGVQLSLECHHADEQLTTEEYAKEVVNDLKHQWSITEHVRFVVIRVHCNP